MAVGPVGNLVAQRDEATLLPLTGQDVVDTTGGAFVAGLTWALSRGEDGVDAARWGTAAAGLTVGHPGGRPALSVARLEELADTLTGSRG